MSVCTSCELAALMEQGTIVTIAIESAHSDCEGDCDCGCPFSRHEQCPDCRRRGLTWKRWSELGDQAPQADESWVKLADDGRCKDKKDCAAYLANWYKERAEGNKKWTSELAASRQQTARPKGSDCLCGCGEKTGGGYYRPGHDARHVSQLVKAVISGGVKTADARGKLAHSETLQAKFEKALANAK